MSGRYPDLANYNDDFLVQTFQIQYPAPTSTDDAICMQNTYTVLRGGRELKDVDGYDSILSFPTVPLVSRVSEPTRTTPQEHVIDFHRYITLFGEHVGWEFLDDLMGDPKKCGAWYCDFGVRNARVAQGYMTRLAIVQPSLRVATIESEFDFR